MDHCAEVADLVILVTNPGIRWPTGAVRLVRFAEITKSESYALIRQAVDHPALAFPSQNYHISIQLFGNLVA